MDTSEWLSAHTGIRSLGFQSQLAHGFDVWQGNYGSFLSFLKINF